MRQAWCLLVILKQFGIGPLHSEMKHRKALLALADANLGRWTKCFHFVGFFPVARSKLLAEFGRLGREGPAVEGSPGSQRLILIPEEISFRSENKSGSLEHILHIQVFLLCKWAYSPCCLCSCKPLPVVI